MLDSIYRSIMEGDISGTNDGVRQALEVGIDAEEILNDAMIAAMEEIGRRFERNMIFVPETLMASEAMEAGMVILRPLLTEADTGRAGKVVLGTVKGDVHDIGKSIVGMMLEGAGFEVVDLGADVPAERFVEASQEHQPRFVGLSALLTTALPTMRSTIQALEEAELRDQVIVMVGGTALSQQLADEIGADLYAPDAGSAVNRAKAFL